MRRLFQFETRKQPVASRNVFVNRLTRNAISSAAIVAVSLVVGTCCYVYFENMRTVDAFANASMILASMGPLNPLLTDGGKIFAALYAIFSGFLLIGISTLMLAPIFHRILHRFHVDEHDADPPQRRH
jgi:putative Mn2+ efflux pump MntP